MKHKTFRASFSNKQLFLLIFIAAIMLCACRRETAPPNEEARSDNRSDTVRIIITEQRTYQPMHVRISSGQTVMWVSASVDSHSVTADPSLANQPGSVQLPPGAQPFDSGPMFYNDTFFMTFTIPGEYRYFCRFHEMAGMMGRITVVGGR